MSSNLLERLEKYKESCRDDDGYILHGEAEVLVFKTLDEIKKLREALEFYSSQYTWENGTYSTVEGDTYEDAPPFIYDMGEIARKALEENSNG